MASVSKRKDGRPGYQVRYRDPAGVQRARQFVRKVSGVQKASDRTEAAFEKAVRRITLATEELLAQLPPRQHPPPTLPPLRRLAAR